MTAISKLVRIFQLDGSPIFCHRFGGGHINETHLIVDCSARSYILQKINRNVFPNTEALMQNILAVTKHIRSKVSSPREVLTLVPTQDGTYWHIDTQGEYWRLYEFVSDSICLQQAINPDDFAQSAIGFGNFCRQLSDFPAETLSEVIPQFHDTPNRYQQFETSLTADTCNRAIDVKEEIAFVQKRADFAKTLMDGLACGKYPLRATHNDTKLNNVLLDRFTRKALCVIDLDTVMPGLAMNDFGDSIRFGASTAAEDEPDLSKVTMSLDLFAAYAKGYLSACGNSLTPAEIDALPIGAMMMTLECGVRFLTDHLAGDTYFKIHRPNHNLDRCRTQFKLVADMEAKQEDMANIIAALMHDKS